MAKGKLIGKVKRPKDSLVYVDGEGNVMAKPLNRRGRTKKKGK